MSNIVYAEQTLTYRKKHDMTTLHNELFAAVPSLVSTDGEGSRSTSARISTDGLNLTIVVPDTVQRSDVDAVVAAHQFSQSAINTRKADTLRDEVIALEQRRAAAQRKGYTKQMNALAAEIAAKEAQLATLTP